MTVPIAPSLVAQIAGGRVTALPRLGGFEPVGNIGGGCHAGAGHGPAAARGAFGPLCGGCWVAVTRLLRGVR